MINNRSIESLISFLTISISYVFSVTIAGYVQAYLAKAFGDDTAEQEGFLTLNPFAHVDPLGSVLFFLIGIGWGMYQPVNPRAYTSWWKLLIVLMSQAFVHCFIALLALISLVGIFGISSLRVAMMMVLYGNLSLSTIATVYPHSSSFVLASALLLIVLIYISVLFAVITAITGIFRFFVFNIPGLQEHFEEGNFLVTLIPLMLLIIFSNTLRIYIVYTITYLGYIIAHLLGAS